MPPLEITAEDKANLAAILRSEAKLQEQMLASVRACDLPPHVPTARELIWALRQAENSKEIVVSGNAAPKSEIELKEAVIDVLSQSAYMTARDLYWQIGDINDTPQLSIIPPQYQPNMKRGEVIPVYRSEAELRLIRDRSRILSANNEFALCAIENRKNYIIGDGFKYTISPRDEKSEADKEAAKECQHVVDAWLEINDMPTLEADSCGRFDEDGEFAIRRWTDDDGFDHLRSVEPEHITYNGGDVTDPRYSFGVETPEDDIETVKAYWILDNPIDNPLSKRVPMSRVVHGKANVKRTAKRGLPTFYPIESNLRRCEDTLASLGHLARARAKIALIRKITGLTTGVAQGLVNKLTDIRATEPVTGSDMNIERMRYGSVLTSSGNVEYEFPNANLGASDIIEVLQADLRACASRLQMPEWMFTALADAKYSNAFVVEGPTYKSFRRIQRQLREHFGLCRYGHRASLLWRQLKTMVKRGNLKPDTLTRIKIQCEGPTLEARDRAAEVERHERLILAHLESTETAQKQLELDPAIENPLIAKETKGKLRPVGDLTVIQNLQIAYTAGQISREAAAANLQLVMGFTSEQAAALLPLSLAVARVDSGAGSGDAPGEPGDGSPDGGGDGAPPGGSDAGGGAQTPAGDAADALLSKIGKEAGGGQDASAAAGGATPIPFAEQTAKHWDAVQNHVSPEVWKLVEHVWTKPTNGFTGIVTASNGVVYHYVSGVRVQGPQYEKHFKDKKVPSKIANPDAEQFAHLIHLVSEHYATGGADKIAASQAIEKLLGKYGGGIKEWTALAKHFGFDPKGKIAPQEFKEFLLKGMTPNIVQTPTDKPGEFDVTHAPGAMFDPTKAAAAKQEHDLLDFGYSSNKYVGAGTDPNLVTPGSHNNVYNKNTGKPFDPNAKANELKVKAEKAEKPEAPAELPPVKIMEPEDAKPAKIIQSPNAKAASIINILKIAAEHADGDGVLAIATTLVNKNGEHVADILKALDLPKDASLFDLVSKVTGKPYKGEDTDAASAMLVDDKQPEPGSDAAAELTGDAGEEPVDAATPIEVDTPATLSAHEKLVAKLDNANADKKNGMITSAEHKAKILEVIDSAQNAGLDPSDVLADAHLHAPSWMYEHENAGKSEEEAAPIPQSDTPKPSAVPFNISPDIHSVMKIKGGFHFDKVNHIKSVSGGVASKHFNNTTKEWTVPGVHKPNPDMATVEYKGKAIDDAAAIVKANAGMHSEGVFGSEHPAVQTYNAIVAGFPGGLDAFKAAEPSILKAAGMPAGEQVINVLATKKFAAGNNTGTTSSGVPSVKAANNEAAGIGSVSGLDKILPYIHGPHEKFKEAWGTLTTAEMKPLYDKLPHKFQGKGTEALQNGLAEVYGVEAGKASIANKADADADGKVDAAHAPNPHVAVLADLAAALAQKTKKAQANAWSMAVNKHGWGAVKAAWEAAGLKGDKGGAPHSPIQGTPSGQFFYKKGVKATHHKAWMHKLKLAAGKQTVEGLAELNGGVVVPAPTSKNYAAAGNGIADAALPDKPYVPTPTTGVKFKPDGGKIVYTPKGELHYPPPAAKPLPAALDIPPGENKYDSFVDTAVKTHAASLAKAEPVPDVKLGSDDGIKPEVWNPDDPAHAIDNTNLYKGVQGNEVDKTWKVNENTAKQAYGGVVLRVSPETGKTQVLLRKPTGGYDNYSWTFPKGKMNDGVKVHPDAVSTALAEVEEETGHAGAVVGHLPGVFKSDGQTTNAFFVMKSTGVDPSKMDKETSAVKWVDLDDAHTHINETTKPAGKARDLAILEAARKYVHDRVPVNTTTGYFIGEASKLVQSIKDNAAGSDAKHLATAVKHAVSKLHPHAVEKVAALHGTTAAGLVQHVVNHAQAGKLGVGIPSHVAPLLANAKPIGKGSTGAKYIETHDNEGEHQKYAVKDGGSVPYGKEQVVNEVAANKLLDAMGAAVPPTKLFNTPAGNVKVSTWVEGQDLGQWAKNASAGDKKAMEKKLQKDYVAHVILNNWDVFGKDADNIKVTPASLPVYIDNGGSFDISANGTKKGADEGKPFSDDATGELMSLKDPAKNHHGAHWYAGITHDDIKKQIAHAYTNKAAIVASLGDSPHAATVAARIDSLHEWAKNDGKGANAVTFKDSHGGELTVYPKHGVHVSPYVSSMGHVEALKWHNHVSADGMKGVKFFTGGGYGSFNRKLFQKEQLDSSDKMHDANLQKAFAAQPEFTKPATYYHGAQLSDKGLASYKARADDGKAVVWSGYQSSCANPANAWNKNALITIKNVKYGAIDVAAVSSAGKGEQETLLNRGIKLRILSVKPFKSSDAPGASSSYKWHVVAEQIPHDVEDNLHEQEHHYPG